MRFASLDFFAGSGLVRLGLEPEFRTVWANDICVKKEAVYRANFSDDVFHLGEIEDVRGGDLPRADLAWASFPCQDLSLAGNLTGIKNGKRSALFWEWLRVLDEMEKNGKRIPLLAAENVVGFLIANGGKHFAAAYRALRERHYLVGALVIDAKLFLPQSRPRAFVVAVHEDMDVADFIEDGPSHPFHPEGLVRTAKILKDDRWLWWSLKRPRGRPQAFSALVESDAPCDRAEHTSTLRGMLSPLNRRKLQSAAEAGMFLVGTGYRRTRPDDLGDKVQRLELRFDGIAGCLRTPEGGSSRQVVMLVDHGNVRTRLMTVRECARLMGAPDSFKIPGSYNDGYRAMGDAVAVPVTRWLTQHLLAPLAERYRSISAASQGAA